MPKFSRRAFLRAIAATPLAAFVPLLSRVPAPVAPTVADWKRVSGKRRKLQGTWKEPEGTTQFFKMDDTHAALTDAQIEHLSKLDCSFDLHAHPLPTPPGTVARLELADGTVYVGGNFHVAGIEWDDWRPVGSALAHIDTIG